MITSRYDRVEFDDIATPWNQGGFASCSTLWRA